MRKRKTETWNKATRQIFQFCNLIILGSNGTNYIRSETFYRFQPFHWTISDNKVNYSSLVRSQFSQVVIIKFSHDLLYHDLQTFFQLNITKYSYSFFISSFPSERTTNNSPHHYHSYPTINHQLYSQKDLNVIIIAVDASNGP